MTAEVYYLCPRAAPRSPSSRPPPPASLSSHRALVPDFEIFLIFCIISSSFFFLLQFFRPPRTSMLSRPAPTDGLRAPVQSPGGGGIRDRRRLRGIRHDVFRHASPTIQAGILEIKCMLFVFDTSTTDDTTALSCWWLLSGA